MRPRTAFTLVELLVALVIGSAVMLLAAMSFRAASSAIVRAERLAEQNELLRVGLWQSLQDADFWLSAADPRPPYHKAWSRQPRTSSTSEAKRPFAPIRFQADPDALSPATQPLVNPAGFLPHRSRCWSRVHCWANQDAFRQEPWSDTTTWNYETHFLPGWDWRTVHGDYGLVEATQMSDTVRFADLAALPSLGPTGFSDREAAFRPLLQRQSFQVLGVLGAASYPPRGSSLAYHDERGVFDDSKGFPALDGVADAERHVNFLHTHKTGIGNAMGFDLYVEDGAMDWTAATHPRFHSGRDGLALRVAATAAVADEIGGRIPFAGLWLAHGDAGQYEGDFTRGGRDASTTPRVPAGVSDSGTDHAWLAARFPGTDPLDWRAQVAESTGTGQHLATTTARYAAFLGGSLSVHRIAVGDTASDEVCEVRFAVTGTTWRGARQHWALVHRRAGGTATTAVTLDGWPMPAGGDFYE